MSLKKGVCKICSQKTKTKTVLKNLKLEERGLLKGGRCCCAAAAADALRVSERALNAVARGVALGVEKNKRLHQRARDRFKSASSSAAVR
jgi:hypothetical protein